MKIERDVAIPMADGIVLRGNLFRPDSTARFPVIVSLGIYGKDIHFADGYAPQWKILTGLYPGLATEGSSGRWLRWEVPDPERFVPAGFAILVVDARGSGKSPGYLDALSPRETQDYAEVIAWAAAQPWSNGRVGLLGVSYLAIKQWQVAALRPPGLAAICPWEGGSDHYRDWSHHGGIPSDGFATAWWPRQVLVNQHGSAATPYRDRDTGEPVTGAPLPEALLPGNRADHPAELARHPLDDAWHRDRSPDLARIEVPLLSAGNWGGPGLHLRGNVEGFLRAGSREKWLSLHVGTHYESFYLPDYVAMQQRFFAHFLADAPNGWRAEPRVRLAIRTPEGTRPHTAPRWPLPETDFQNWYLDARNLSLSRTPPEAAGSLDYTAEGAGVTFTTAPFATPVTLAGPIVARLSMVSSTDDLDLFVTLRVLRPDGSEFRFTGAHEPTPLTRGWLRASHRRIDRARSRPFRPWHLHEAPIRLAPGEVADLGVEIWPTSFAFPAGWRLAVTLQGRDFEYPGIPGRILHGAARQNEPARFGNTHRLLSGPNHPCHILLPVIPEAR
jgi:predicted acyl esterase